MLKIVIETNVVLSALKSNQGASYVLITLQPPTKFATALSVPLYTEYQDVLTREKNMTGASTKENILAYCRYLPSKDYLDEEAKKATREDFDKVMRAVPDAEAAEYDKL